MRTYNPSLSLPIREVAHSVTFPTRYAEDSVFLHTHFIPLPNGQNLDNDDDDDDDDGGDGDDDD